MDPKCNNSFSLSLELSIIRARNINLNSPQEIFVRCYLSTGSNKRVKLDSQEISPKSDLNWNQTFSLGCLGNEDTINCLKQGNIIFELRQRRSTPLIGKINGSTLIAKGEIPWTEVVHDVPNVEIEKWVVMIPKIGRVYDDVIKPPGVLIGMKIEESIYMKVSENKRICERRWDDYCGCKSCVAYECFAIEAALEAF